MLASITALLQPWVNRVDIKKADFSVRPTLLNLQNFLQTVIEEGHNKLGTCPSDVKPVKIPNTPIPVGTLKFDVPKINDDGSIGPVPPERQAGAVAMAKLAIGQGGIWPAFQAVDSRSRFISASNINFSDPETPYQSFVQLIDGWDRKEEESSKIFNTQIIIQAAHSALYLLNPTTTDAMKQAWKHSKHRSFAIFPWELAHVMRVNNLMLQNMTMVASYLKGGAQQKRPELMNRVIEHEDSHVDELAAALEAERASRQASDRELENAHADLIESEDRMEGLERENEDLQAGLTLDAELVARDAEIQRLRALLNNVPRPYRGADGVVRAPTFNKCAGYMVRGHALQYLS